MNKEEILCRICLEDCQNNFECVFTKLKSCHYQLSHLGVMYEDLFKLPIRLESGEAEHICKKCAQQVDDFHKFKTKAIKSYQQLCQFVKNDNNEVEQEIKIEYEEESFNNNDGSPQLDPLEATVEEDDLKEEVKEVEKSIDSDRLAKFKTEDTNTVDENNKKGSVKSQKPDRQRIAKQNRKNTSENFECKNCKLVFNSQRLLIKHRSSRHKRETYSCNQCSKKFRIKEILEVHLKTHEGLPAYECELCKKSFNQKGQYTIHLNTHQNVRNAQCHLCGKGFLTKGDLKVHFRSHSDERRYECDVCGKKFLAHSHMTNHRYTHLGKTLKCEFCEQMYTTPITLRTHIRAVHKNICPYTCKVCSKQFKRHHHLKAHLNTH